MKNIAFLITIAVLFGTGAVNAQQILRSVTPITGTSVDITDQTVVTGYGSAVNSQGWEDQYGFPSLTAYSGTPSVGSTLTLFSTFELNPGTTSFPVYTINLDLTKPFTFAQYEATPKTLVGTAIAVVQPDMHTVLATGTGIDGYVAAAKLANVDFVFGYTGFIPTYYQDSKTSLTFAVPEPKVTLILIFAAFVGACLVRIRRCSGPMP